MGQSQSEPRANSLSGGRWLQAPPLAVQPATASPPPPLPWARPAVGAGGREGGARARWTFLAPSRPRSLQRRGQKGHRVNPLFPGTASSRGLQGSFELGRIWVPPHPSTNRGSRVLQGRIWGSRVLQGVLCCRHRGSQRLLLWSGVSGTGRSTSPPGAAQPPPPPPSLRGWAGQAQVRSSATRGGRAASGADRQRRPSQHRGAAARMPARGGGGGGS